MYTVADLMTRDVVTLSEDDDLGLADSILALGRIRHLPVVDGDRLVGLVTHRDLVQALARGARGARRVHASEVMHRDLRTVGPHTPLRRAAELMLREKLGCLPVVEGERLVGIITEADLVRFALDVIVDLEKAADGLQLEERAAARAAEADEPHP